MLAILIYAFSMCNLIEYNHNCITKRPYIARFKHSCSLLELLTCSELN